MDVGSDRVLDSLLYPPLSTFVTRIEYACRKFSDARQPISKMSVVTANKQGCLVIVGYLSFEVNLGHRALLMARLLNVGSLHVLA